MKDRIKLAGQIGLLILTVFIGLKLFLPADIGIHELQMNWFNIMRTQLGLRLYTLWGDLGLCSVVIDYFLGDVVIDLWQKTLMILFI